MSTRNRKNNSSKRSAARQTGKVLWFNPVLGYGVIERNNKGKTELFVHHSSIHGTNFIS